ncbi:MAG: hypothetical protein IKY53_07465, partial [Lachnospiraceae bacterium]|nr:hypothetical protein [Lachnospiraceae bacterium]
HYWLLPLGSSGPLDILMKTSGSGIYTTDQFNYTVTGDGLGLQLAADSYGAYLIVVGNKKGMYNITLTTKEGCGAKCMTTIKVY